jgi:hypothetical protein
MEPGTAARDIVAIKLSDAATLTIKLSALTAVKRYTITETTGAAFHEATQRVEPDITTRAAVEIIGAGVAYTVYDGAAEALWKKWCEYAGLNPHLP